MLKHTNTMLGLFAACFMSFAAVADSSHTKTTAISHAPIGVMGDHLHKKGEFMFSYRLMNMEMSGNIEGSNNITNDEIVTQLANPYANPPMSPPTVRVVPQDMTTQMHMLGFMYAPTDDITLMAMVNYLDRKMTLTSYQGGMGTNVLGNFDTATSGMGDSKLVMLYRLFDSKRHKLHANVGWVIPTGSVEEEGQVLTPMNTRPTLRAPYAMQLGSDTHQGEVGLTYNGNGDNIAWGAQGLYMTSLGKNDQGWQPGNKIQLTAWGSYAFSDVVSTSIRLSYMNSDEIEGADLLIRAPVTTANPDNYGGNLLDLGFGVNTVIAHKHRLAFEYSVPVSNSVNGVQMEMDNMLTLGYQIAF